MEIKSLADNVWAASIYIICISTPFSDPTFVCSWKVAGFKLCSNKKPQSEQTF